MTIVDLDPVLLTLFYKLLKGFVGHVRFVDEGLMADGDQSRDAPSAAEVTASVKTGERRTSLNR